ncbi:YdcF family protein [Leptolyngbya sp. AN02str]|uniref:YdcF family protein n=1 Tax=Leptolyngbya sp. AN02str TaxID=3423363 RepID=UPI003D3172E0
MLDFLRMLIGRRWTRFTWGLYEWFLDPRLVTLAILVTFGVLLLLSSRRYRKRLLTLLMVVLGSYWFMLSPLFATPATAALVRFIPKDSGTPADAVVVLARGDEIEGDRYQSALELVEQGRAPRMFVTGSGNLVSTFLMLQEQAVDPTLLSGTVCARTTKDEAYSTAAILGSEGAKTIILITDPPHMLRSMLTFQGVGFQVIPHVEPAPPTLTTAERSLLAVREYLGLVSYGLLGRFRAPENPNQPEIHVLSDEKRRSCQVTAQRIEQWLASN